LTIFFYKYRIKEMNLTKVDKQKIIHKLQKFLSEELEIVFAYLHGSFLNEDEFKDIDIALCLDEKTANKIDLVASEITWSLRLEKYLFVPVDVKIINGSPLNFRYHVTRGYLLLCRDDLKREEFLCKTWSEYFDFKPVSKIYLREIFIA